MSHAVSGRSLSCSSPGARPSPHISLPFAFCCCGTVLVTLSQMLDDGFVCLLDFISAELASSSCCRRSIWLWDYDCWWATPVGVTGLVEAGVFVCSFAVLSFAYVYMIRPSKCLSASLNFLLKLASTIAVDASIFASRRSSTICSREASP
jgi:hypothetical protein